MAAERAKVYLVGAGPGDPDLLTRKAARILAEAEAVIYDKIVSPEVLALANPHATIHYTRPVAAGQRENASKPGNETLRFPRATTELPPQT